MLTSNLSSNLTSEAIEAAMSSEATQMAFRVDININVRVINGTDITYEAEVALISLELVLARLKDHCPLVFGH